MDLFVFWELELDNPNEAIRYLQVNLGAKQIKHVKISDISIRITFKLSKVKLSKKLAEFKSFTNTISIKIYDKTTKKFEYL